MNILITGAGGFLGNNICQYLYKFNHKIYAIYRNNPPQILGVELIKCDLSKKIISIENYKIDAIIHLAGQMKGDTMAEYIQNTVDAMKNLLNYAEKKNIKTFIYASSIAVYGEVDSIVNECSDRKNMNDYGCTKYICERLLEDSSIINRIVLRLPRILGKGIDLSYPWIPNLTYKIMNNLDVNYFNPELLYNNMAHIESVSEFINLLLNKNNIGYRLLCIGSASPIKVIDIIQFLKKAFNSKSHLNEIQSNKKNTCFQIDIQEAINAGYRPQEVLAVLDIFVKEILN